MNTIHLKIKSPSEIRRISIAKDVSLEVLRQEIDKLFLGSGVPVNYSIKYVDEDNDLISVVTEPDWREAINIAESRNLNLIVHLGEALEIRAPINDEVSQLEKEFVFLSAAELPVNNNDVLEQAINGAKEFLDVAKERFQTIISEEIPRAGNEFQNFLAKQGQNAEDVLHNIHDFVKNAIEHDLEPIKKQKEVVLNAKIVSDVTIPDGTVIEANSSFVKTWEIKNDGNVNWPVGAQIRPISALRLSSEPFQAVPSVVAGELVRISIEMVAPAEPGKYRSFYRLFHPDTLTPFGDIFWVDFIVSAPYKYRDQLASLLEMGFDESVCRFLLDEHNGNIEECMVELTN